MTTIKVTDKYGKEHTVQYTQNLRFTDFMKVNKYSLEQVNTASDVFNLCKADWTRQVMEQTKKGIVDKASTRAVLLKNGFRFRRTVQYQAALPTGSVDEIEAVINWREKRVEASEKAQSMAAEFLSEYQTEPVKSAKAA
jgi:hypothetical protein